MSGGLIWNPNTGNFETLDTSASSDSTVSAYDYFNGLLPQQDLATPEKPGQPCVHLWQQYQGFRESYWYCQKCDYKRPTE